VSSVNDAPAASDDRANTYYMQAVSIDALANDTDIDGNALKISAVAAPKNGKTIIQGNKISYTPAEGFTGEDTFSYTITDGTEKATAGVAVTVSYPEFYSKSTAVFSLAVGGTGNANPGDTNTGGASGSSGSGSGEMTIVSQPAGGTVTTVGGSAYYTPGEGTTGIDTYRVVMGTGTGDVEYQVITNTDVQTGETTIVGYGLPLLDGNFDTNGEIRIPLDEYLGDSYDENSEITIEGQPVNGSVRVEGGYLVYKPSDGFSGLDAVVFTINMGDEQIPYAATFNVEGAQPLFSMWCVLGWAIAALLLTINYIRRRDYFSERKARTAFYIALSVVMCVLLCWLRNYTGYYVSAAIMVAYIAGVWLCTGSRQKRCKAREIML